MFLKYKMLVNGLSVVGNYTIDGFTLKEGFFNKELFDQEYKRDELGISINMNLYLVSCLTNYDKLSYNYFESNDYIEIEVSNKTKKDNLNKVLKTNKNIVDKVLDLEMKIRIILNIPILFQSIDIEFYDENKNYVWTCQINRPISYWNRLMYKLPNEEINNNSRFHIDIDSMKNTNNNHFKRAIEFYNDSFDSDKITNRYILIFSSLESIFNLDTKDVTEKISRYSAKLLAEDNEKEYNQIYTDIRKLYRKRCNYIHGSKKNNINEDDEKLLRRYVRKIIIAYWMIILNTKMTSMQILKYLDSEKKLDLKTRLVISTINSNSFSEQQHKAINIVEKEFGRPIPKETKKLILSNCDKE